MKTPKETRITTIHDFAIDICNGFIIEGCSFFDDYFDKAASYGPYFNGDEDDNKDNNFVLSGVRLRYFMKNLLPIWINLQNYSEEKRNFEVDINWNVYNELLQIDLSFLANSPVNKLSLFEEKIQNVVAKLPNKVIMVIYEL